MVQRSKTVAWVLLIKGRNEGGWQGLGLRKEVVQGVLILAEQDKGMDMSVDKE